MSYRRLYIRSIVADLLFRRDIEEHDALAKENPLI